MRRLAIVIVLLAACHTDTRFETLHEDQVPVGDPANIEVVTLSNGLRVGLLRDPRAQVASVDLRYEVGTADDPTMQPGLALLVGQLLAQTPMADRGNGAPADVDLTVSLAVDLDRTELTSTMFDLDGALELEARRLETSCESFAPELLAQARERATALVGTPPSLVAAVWGAGHPYAHGLIDPRLVATATSDEICAFYRAHYGPSAATLVVTGAFDTNLMDRLRTRFERVPRTQLAARAAVPALQRSDARMRVGVWGLGKPTAALVFPMPTQGSSDEVMAELAMREVASWNKSLHVALVGGRRARALVIALEGDRESDLAKLHDKLRDLVATSYTLATEGRSNTTPEDSLGAAQELDDPFHRGAQIAEAIASGRPVQRLSRAKAYVDAHLTYHWMRLHLIEVTPRALDLIPATPGHDEGMSIEALAEPATGVDRALAPASTAMPPVPVRAIARPITDYALANGLRVVLAPDPFATTVDARIVFPIGSRDETQPGLAAQAAVDLESSEDVDYDASQKMEWYGKREALHDTDVTASRTRFRVIGLSGLAEWHVWALAFRITTGHYEHATTALGRWHSHYVPKGATLIVSGGFDLARIRKTIDTWFGPWRAVDPSPIAHTSGPSKPVIELADEGTLELELAYELPDHAITSRAAALVLANLAQQRLTAATRGIMEPSVAYDVSEHRLVIAGQADPQMVTQAFGDIDRELARLRDEAPADVELERARRVTVAITLGGELGDSGRARLLEEHVLAGLPLAGADSLVADVTALTAADLRAAATELFDHARRSVALRASKAEGERVLVALGIDPHSAAVSSP